MSTVTKMRPMNEAGIAPCGDRVLIRPDPIEDEITEAGFVLPDQYRKKYENAQASGTLVAVGPDAFRHVTERVYRIKDDGRKELAEERLRGYSGPFAAIGERVAFAQYSGVRVRGEDGELYIILNDEDITARISDAVEFTQLDTRKPLGEQRGSHE